LSQYADRNIKALAIVALYQETLDMSLLRELHDLLLPESRFEIRKVLSKLHLPSDLLVDMEQDSFLKLMDVIHKFQIERSDKFISFWQRVLFNFLISKYSRRNHVQQITIDVPCREQHFCDEELAHLIKDKFLKLVENWKSPNDREIALMIFNQRFMAVKDELSQVEVAELLNLSQSHIHRWEAFILSKLKSLATETVSG
jgi:RNA polymerase sigma factor (sigma-70 family)